MTTGWLPPAALAAAATGAIGLLIALGAVAPSARGVFASGRGAPLAAAFGEGVRRLALPGRRRS